MVDGSQAREDWLAKAELADVIVFDLDGTLVDSDLANFLSYKDAVMRVLSRQVNMDTFQSARITREILAEIIPNITDEQLIKIALQKERIYPKYLSKTNINPQLIEIIDQSGGKDVVLATDSRRYRADMLLNHHGLTEKFSRKIYRNTEDKRNKYVRLMSEIPKEKMSIMVFENDEHAIDLAIACGISIDQIIDVRRI